MLRPVTMLSARVPTRIFLGVIATASVTFALYKLFKGDSFYALLILSLVIGLTLLVKDKRNRSMKTVLGAGFLAFAAISVWWPILELLVQR